MSNPSYPKPVLVGDFWMAGLSPDLGHIAPDLQAEGEPRHECVDHHVFQSADGAWQLWGCIRLTPVGRILYRWEADAITQTPWRQTDEIMRVDRDAGESLDDWRGEEWIQSPYVVQHQGLYHMFYGGHGTGIDERGIPIAPGNERVAGQICLATSPDGRTWTRHAGHSGNSRLFIGPGETRDPCLIQIDGLWHLYYAGYHDEDAEKPGFYVRTSTDLIHWSGWRLVHFDLAFGGGRWDTECPHVVYREGAYYLFRTEDYAGAVTHVFRSEAPYDFGIGDASETYVGDIAVAAPEIIVDADGNEYITSNHDLRGGTHICRLGWEPAS
jgi:beta-fructofuranosidase